MVQSFVAIKSNEILYVLRFGRTSKICLETPERSPAAVHLWGGVLRLQAWDVEAGNGGPRGSWGGRYSPHLMPEAALESANTWAQMRGRVLGFAETWVRHDRPPPCPAKGQVWLEHSCGEKGRKEGPPLSCMHGWRPWLGRCTPPSWARPSLSPPLRSGFVSGVEMRRKERGG